MTDQAPTAEELASTARHRRPGSASLRGPAPETRSFGQVVNENHREILIVGAGSLVGFCWGAWAVVDSNGPGLRILGLLSVMAAVVLLVSYVLRFQPSRLEAEGWGRTRLRRALRFLLRNAWRLYLTVAFIAGVGILLEELVR